MNCGVWLFVAKSQRYLPDHPRVGSLVTPSNGATPGRVWAADNEAFVGFDARRFSMMLERIETIPGCQFVAVPDVVADHKATLARWRRWRGRITQPAAFVLQDGCQEVPDDADAVFVGGSTEWKLSDDARRLVEGFDGWRHMGRVNSVRRLRLAKSWGIDSVDGTGMARYTDTKLPLFLEATEHMQGHLLTALSGDQINSLGVGAVEVETPTHAGKSPTPGSPPRASND